MIIELSRRHTNVNNVAGDNGGGGRPEVDKKEKEKSSRDSIEKLEENNDTVADFFWGWFFGEFSFGHGNTGHCGKRTCCLCSGLPLILSSSKGKVSSCPNLNMEARMTKEASDSGARLKMILYLNTINILTAVCQPYYMI